MKSFKNGHFCLRIGFAMSFLSLNGPPPGAHARAGKFNDETRLRIAHEATNEIEQLTTLLAQLDSDQEAESVQSHRAINHSRYVNLELTLGEADSRLKELRKARGENWRSKANALRDSINSAQKSLDKGLDRQNFIEWVNSRIYRVNSQIQKMNYLLSIAKGVERELAIKERADLVNDLSQIEERFEDLKTSVSEDLSENQNKITQKLEKISQKYNVLN